MPSITSVIRTQSQSSSQTRKKPYTRSTEKRNSPQQTRKVVAISSDQQQADATPQPNRSSSPSKQKQIPSAETTTVAPLSTKQSDLNQDALPANRKRMSERDESPDESPEKRSKTEHTSSTEDETGQASPASSQEDEQDVFEQRESRQTTFSRGKRKRSAKVQGLEPKRSKFEQVPVGKNQSKRPGRKATGKTSPKRSTTTQKAFFSGKRKATLEREKTFPKPSRVEPVLLQKDELKRIAVTVPKETPLSLKPRRTVPVLSTKNDPPYLKAAEPGKTLPGRQFSTTTDVEQREPLGKQIPEITRLPCTSGRSECKCQERLDQYEPVSLRKSQRLDPSYQFEKGAAEYGFSLEQLKYLAKKRNAFVRKDYMCSSSLTIFPKFEEGYTMIVSRFVSRFNF